MNLAHNKETKSLQGAGRPFAIRQQGACVWACFDTFVGTNVTNAHEPMKMS